MKYEAAKKEKIPTPIQYSIKRRLYVRFNASSAFFNVLELRHVVRNVIELYLCQNIFRPMMEDRNYRAITEILKLWGFLSYTVPFADSAASQVSQACK